MAINSISPLLSRFNHLLISAYFVKLACKAIYIHVEVLYSRLTDKERNELIAKFNDPNLDIVGLVLMYNVASQGSL